MSALQDSANLNWLAGVVHYPIFFFSLLGALGSVWQHGFNAPEALRPLSPGSFGLDGSLTPTGEFWGGGAYASMSLGIAVTHLVALFSGSAQARRAALLGSSATFAAMALLWSQRGHQVRKHDPRNVVGLEVALSIIFCIGGLTAERASEEWGQLPREAVGQATHAAAKVAHRVERRSGAVARELDEHADDTRKAR